MSELIACSHPGKSGDILYSVPAAKYLCQLHQTKCHFYISSEYGWLKRLLDYQDYIEECIIPETYKIDHHGHGAQPWDMSPHFRDINYQAVYQFGYRAFPDITLPVWHLNNCGISLPPSGQELMLGFLKYPELPRAPLEIAAKEPTKYILDEPYVVMAPRHDLTPGLDGRTMKDIFYDFAARCPVRIVQIGRKGEAWPWENSLDITGVDWLETVSWLSRAVGFYGIIFSQGALAHNFDYPKVFPHNNGGWDLRHVVITPSTLYAVMPSAERVLKFLKLESANGN